MLKAIVTALQVKKELKYNMNFDPHVYIQSTLILRSHITGFVADD